MSTEVETRRVTRGEYLRYLLSGPGDNPPGWIPPKGVNKMRVVGFALTLASFSPDGSDIHPTLPTLARRAGCSVKTARRDRDEVVNFGLFEVVGKTRTGGPKLAVAIPAGQGAEGTKMGTPPKADSVGTKLSLGRDKNDPQNKQENQQGSKEQKTRDKVVPLSTKADFVLSDLDSSSDSEHSEHLAKLPGNEDPNPTLRRMYFGATCTECRAEAARDRAKRERAWDKQLFGKHKPIQGEEDYIKGEQAKTDGMSPEDEARAAEIMNAEPYHPPVPKTFDDIDFDATWGNDPEPDYDIRPMAG
jgi:hypothetical protein